VIVELIGCDGAGKTTLGRMLAEPGVLGARALVMADLVLDRPGLRGITHPTARNVVQEVGGLPFLLGAFGRWRAYLGFALRMHARYAPSAYHRLNGMRGILRRVGMYELARSCAADRIVLSDEGTVLSAYLFALTDIELDRSHVARFAELVPAPDLMIYVKAPVDVLVERALARPDRRPQHAGKSRSEVERTISRTAGVFDLIAGSAPLRDRVLVVENDEDHERLRRAAGGIASELRVSANASGVPRPPRAARVSADRLHAGE
jgi:thymidylate kinase